MTKSFGERLKRARLSEALSQVELAQRIEVTQPAVANWEAGSVKPKPAHLGKLERLFGNLREPTKRDEQSEEPEAATGVFGAWLRRARNEANMSVPALAAASKVSPVAIYNIESGKSLNPQAETRKRLREALKVQFPEGLEEEASEEQNITGLGPLTDFDPHDRNALPRVPGVYVFYDVSDRPVYVGQGQDIAKRVKDHHIAFWFKAPIVSNGAYVEIKEETLRSQVEQVLIRFLKSNAVLNKHHVVRESEA